MERSLLGDTVLVACVVVTVALGFLSLTDVAPAWIRLFVASSIVFSLLTAYVGIAFRTLDWNGLIHGLAIGAILLGSLIAFALLRTRVEPPVLLRLLAAPALLAVGARLEVRREAHLLGIEAPRGGRLGIGRFER